MNESKKKLFISADIEGTAGIDTWDETQLGQGTYAYFSGQMTREVSSAVNGAEAAGYVSAVKDAHDSARNLRLEDLPESAVVIRGWTRDLWCMMGGLNLEHYDAVAFTGYHSDALSDGNPLSHTMTTSVQAVYLNGKRASEFTLNAYMAAMLQIPIVFLSGDAALCEAAKELVPGITTVASKTGLGSAVSARHPAVVCREIREAMEAALQKLEDPAERERCMLKMPDSFTLTVVYKDWNSAHRYSFYPGAVSVDAKTVSYTSENYEDVMRFMHFCL
ncbi:MAG: M55 family metallopeptidase [Clostridia bacterium]|nr:M55 family metallopeptidase [Clostridia bacterium]